MAFFTTTVRHQRLSYSPFTADQMNTIAQAGLKSIVARIRSATNINDSPAKALSPGYAKFKENYGRKYSVSVAPQRDWVLTGRTIGSAKVKLASEDHAVLGFLNNYLNRKITVEALVTRLQQQHPMWGFSPKDWEAVIAEVRNQIAAKSPVVIERTT